MAMFLHSGASLHGHEYSSPAPPHRLHKRAPFLRSALRPMSENETNGAHLTPPQNGLGRSMSQRQTPSKIPRPLSHVPTPPLSPNEHTPRSRPRPRSDYLPRKEHSVRFAEPTDEIDELPTPRNSEPYALQGWSGHSEDESAYSEASDGNTNTSLAPRRKKRRTPRSGTRYLLAQRPSHVIKRHRRFINLRPSLLLQLQQLTDTRPKPAFDVLPSSILRGHLKGAPRLSGRFPRPFGFRHELGSDDLILAQSEDYDSETPDDGSDKLGNREVLAIISPRSGADGCTDIVLTDGTIWTASMMPAGSYEFTTMRPDGGVVTARWVRRRVPLEDEDNYKFTFSLVDPTSRRHPIMGTLTPGTLEVLDNYTTVSPHSSRKHPPTRPFSMDANGVPAERSTVPIDEATRAFITVSGAWISLVKLGVAAAPKVATHATKGPVPPPSTSLDFSSCNGRYSSPRQSQSWNSYPSEPLVPAGDVRRRWTVSGRRSGTRSPQPPPPPQSRPVEAEEVLGLGAGTTPEKEKEGKKKFYGRIKRVLGLRKDEER